MGCPKRAAAGGQAPKGRSVNSRAPFNAEGLGAAGVIYFANCVPSVASILSAALLYTVNSQNALENREQPLAD